MGSTTATIPSVSGPLTRPSSVTEVETPDPVSGNAGNDGEDASFTPPTTGRALRGLAREFVGGGQSNRRPVRRPAAKASIVNRLDRREITVGVVLTVLNLYIVVFWSRHLNASATESLRSQAQTFFDTSLIATAIVVLGLAVRRRALLGFACFLAALDFQHYNLFLQFVLNVAVGGWLLLRAQKAQKAQRGSTTRPAPSRVSRTDKRSAPSARAPQPSKRYTPPKRSKTAGRR
jgi:hypothetical protein